VELVEDVLDVEVDRVPREMELCGHLGVRRPLRDELEHLLLARREHVVAPFDPSSVSRTNSPRIFVASPEESAGSPETTASSVRCSSSPDASLSK
jgi:hypothetical protein